MNKSNKKRVFSGVPPPTDQARKQKRGPQVGIIHPNAVCGKSNNTLGQTDLLEDLVGIAGDNEGKIEVGSNYPYADEILKEHQEEPRGHDPIIMGRNLPSTNTTSYEFKQYKNDVKKERGMTMSYEANGEIELNQIDSNKKSITPMRATVGKKGNLIGVHDHEECPTVINSQVNSLPKQYKGTTFNP